MLLFKAPAIRTYLISNRKVLALAAVMLLIVASVVLSVGSRHARVLPRRVSKGLFILGTSGLEEDHGWYRVSAAGGAATRIADSPNLIADEYAFVQTKASAMLYRVTDGAIEAIDVQTAIRHTIKPAELCTRASILPFRDGARIYEFDGVDWAIRSGFGQSRPVRMSCPAALRGTIANPFLQVSDTGTIFLLSMPENQIRLVYFDSRTGEQRTVLKTTDQCRNAIPDPEGPAVFTLLETGVLSKYSWVAGSLSRSWDVQLRSQHMGCSFERLLGAPDGEWVHYSVIYFPWGLQTPCEAIESFNLKTAEVFETLERPSADLFIGYKWAFRVPGS